MVGQQLPSWRASPSPPEPVPEERHDRYSTFINSSNGSDRSSKAYTTMDMFDTLASLEVITRGRTQLPNIPITSLTEETLRQWASLGPISFTSGEVEWVVTC